MAGTVLAITNAGNWIMLAVCGAEVGLIFAILAMIWFEPFVIIATALAGGFGAGMMIYDLAGLKNAIFMWIISIGITFIGIVIQFIMKSGGRSTRSRFEEQMRSRKKHQKKKK